MKADIIITDSLLHDFVIMNLREKVRENPRIVSPFFMLIGALLFHISFLQPLNEIENGAEEVRFTLGGAVLGVLTILMGIVFLIFGKRYVRFIMMPNEERPKKQKYIIIGISFFVAIVSYFLLDQYLKSKGYSFQ